MRLIKPTTLLLLMAIACGTGSPQDGHNGGSGGSGATLTPEQQCTIKHCLAQINNCYKDPKCKSIFLCGTSAKGDLTKAFNCGKDIRARRIVQCAADNGCFNQKDDCPTLLGLSHNKHSFPNLVKQMAPSFWYAVLSNNDKPESYFNFGCNKLAVVGSKNTKDGVGIALSVCGRNETGGACVTPYFNFFGEGNQIGNTGEINVYLKEGAYVIQPAKLYINVVGATNHFAIVSSCLATPKDIQVSDTYAVFSRYKTYEETLAKSGNSVYEERVLQHVLSGLKQDFSKFHKINASLCEN